MDYYIFIQPVRNIETGELYGAPGVDRVAADKLPANRIEPWLSYGLIIKAAADDPLIPQTE